MEQYRPNNGLFDLAATAGVVYLGVYSLLLNLALIGEGVDIWALNFRNLTNMHILHISLFLAVFRSAWETIPISQAPIFRLLSKQFKVVDTLHWWGWSLAYTANFTSIGANFHPIGAKIRTWGPKTKHFTQFRTINAPQGRISWAIVTNFSGFVDSFMFGQVLEFGWIRSTGFGLNGDLNLGVRFAPKFQCPIAAKLYFGC